MGGYFLDALRAIKNFTGLKPLFGIAVIAWFYLFFREKNKSLRVVFVAMPLIMMLIFICPLTMWAFDKAGLDLDTYYRMLWIVPIGMMSVYTIVKLIGKNFKTRIAGLVLTTALIVFSGQYIYNSPIFFESENLYGIPQQTIDVVDYIRSQDSHEIINICPSADLITTIRQYDSKMRMPYGRDMFNASLNYYHPMYEVFEQTPRLNFNDLVKTGREFEVEYYIVYSARLLDDSPEDAGLMFIGEVKDHLIYKDPVISKQIELLEEYY
ncbi:MAG: hypothetical protein MJZ11_05415 [Lachnospiraceae bacterium]|nr:hypothetical protein [Lachnospiraceae bacterium]